MPVCSATLGIEQKIPDNLFSPSIPSVGNVFHHDYNYSYYRWTPSANDHSAVNGVNAELSVLKLSRTLTTHSLA